MSNDFQEQFLKRAFLSVPRFSGQPNKCFPRLILLSICFLSVQVSFFFLFCGLLSIWSSVVRISFLSCWIVWILATHVVDFHACFSSSLNGLDSAVVLTLIQHSDSAIYSCFNLKSNSEAENGENSHCFVGASAFLFLGSHGRSKIHEV